MSSGKIFAADGSEFLGKLFEQLRAGIQQEYESYMKQHDEYITTGMAKDEYTRAMVKSQM
jgi:hypothetical protein